MNGILTSENEAKDDLNTLRDKFEKKLGKNTGTIFITGYNPTHLAGAGDLVQSAAQMLGWSVSDYDLDTILMQIQPEVTTRKVLLLGHSQGTFYTNAMYSYLLSHGEPREAVGVYNIATPASSVAGGGAYLTSHEDSLIAMLIAAAREVHAPQPLPPNIDIPLAAADLKNPFPGHLLSDAYLTGAPDRIVGDINSALSKLQPAFASNTGDCFDAPDPSLGYRAQQVALAVADPVAKVTVVGTTLGVEGLAAVGSLTLGAIQTGVAAVASLVGGAAQVASSPAVNPAAPENRDKNFAIMKKLYGSSLSTEDLDELNGVPPGKQSPSSSNTNQGASVALAPSNIPASKTPATPLVASAATSSASTTASTLPSSSLLSGGGSNNSFVVDTTVDTDASTTAATTTPALFVSTTTPPALTLSDCAAVVAPATCTIAATTTPLVWSDVLAAVYYGIEVNGVEVATTTATSSAVVLPNEATSTLAITAYDASGAATSSLLQQVYVWVPPPVATDDPSTTNAPFSDSFDSYFDGGLYTQSMWQSEQHAWQVTTAGCYQNTGKCVISSGTDGENWKSGADMAKGQWTIRFYASGSLGYGLVRIYFGNSSSPSGKSEIDFQKDTDTTFKILDNRSNTFASGLYLGEWHILTYRWDMTDPHACHFSVSIDGLPDVASAPSTGDPSNCYNDIYSGRVIGSMGLLTERVGNDMFRIDAITGGPVVNGCFFNCAGDAPTTIIDTFSNYDSQGWKVPHTDYGTLIDFTADDGTDGSCRDTGSGCIVGNGGLGGLGTPSHEPYIYKETGVGTSAGAYTVWAKAVSGFMQVTGNIGICSAIWTDCYGPYVKLFDPNMPNDNVWHQYYIAWRQGASSIETCLLQDDTKSADCVWKSTSFPLGTQFDGVALSGVTLRSDLGDHIWFEDLVPVSL